MNRGGIQSDLVDRIVGREFNQRGNHAPVALFDEQSLRVHPPQHVVALERFEQRAVVGVREVKRLGGLPSGPDNAVDAAMPLVAEGRLIRAALAGHPALGNRIVLNDVVVPVDHPDRPVRPDLGRDGSLPFIV